MYLGTQNRVTTDDEYRQFAQLGIRHVCADPGRQSARLDAATI